jgi:hypothetical protein
MSDLLRQLEEVRRLVILKHQAGRHDQSAHTPKKYGKGGAVFDTQIVDEAGNPLVVYHGTTSEFEEFQPGKPSKSMQLGFGIHFAEQPEFADIYAADKKGRSGRVVKAMLKADNVLDATQIVSEGSPEYTLAKKLARDRFYPVKDEHGVRGVYVQNMIDVSSPARAAKLIQEAGYDAVKYEAIYGTHGDVYGYRQISHTSPSYIVFNPDQIVQVD